MCTCIWMWILANNFNAHLLASLEYTNLNIECQRLAQCANSKIHKYLFRLDNVKMKRNEERKQAKWQKDWKYPRGVLKIIWVWWRFSTFEGKLTFLKENVEYHFLSIFFIITSFLVYFMTFLNFSRKKRMSYRTCIDDSLLGNFHPWIYNN